VVEGGPGVRPESERGRAGVAVVEDIGSALGVVYEDDEELTSEKKISDRDQHPWELDPETSVEDEAP